MVARWSVPSAARLMVLYGVVSIVQENKWACANVEAVGIIRTMSDHWAVVAGGGQLHKYLPPVGVLHVTDKAPCAAQSALAQAAPPTPLEQRSS